MLCAIASCSLALAALSTPPGPSSGDLVELD